MLLYEVTLETEPEHSDAVLAYLRRHIPEIFATRCFERIRFDRASPTRFRTCYQAATAADLERYLETHAAGFRAEFRALFPGGVTVRRETWTEESWWG